MQARNGNGMIDLPQNILRLLQQAGFLGQQPNSAVARRLARTSTGASGNAAVNVRVRDRPFSSATPLLHLSCRYSIKNCSL